MARAAFGPIPGEVMLVVGLVFNGLLFLIGFGTARLTQASGEVLPKFSGDNWFAQWTTSETAEANTSAKASGRPAARFARRQQLLALIITNKPNETAAHILKEMKRGVTALHGKGMYTGQEREVLMIAVTTTEMPQLKQLVNDTDPNAFVVVTPAKEVLGRGFQPLAKDK
jgi:hypothetical protein